MAWPTHFSRRRFVVVCGESTQTSPIRRPGQNAHIRDGSHSKSRIRICTNSPKTKGCWSSAPTRVACLSGAKTGQSLQRGGWTFGVGGWAWSEDQPHCYHSREGFRWWWWWHVTWHHDSVTHAHAVQFEWLPNTISYFLKAIPNFIQTLPKWMCDTYMKGIHPWLQHSFQVIKARGSCLPLQIPLLWGMKGPRRLGPTPSTKPRAKAKSKRKSAKGTKRTKARDTWVIQSIIAAWTSCANHCPRQKKLIHN